jgi:hypothetical protein
VAITAGFAAGDQLVFADQNGISGSYNAGTGVLTLTGHATKAEYETALESVAFDPLINLLDISASIGQREITFSVNDGDASSEGNAASKALIDLVIGDLII